MDKKCSICGNIYKNQVFKGGYICADCLTLIKSVDLPLLHAEEDTLDYKHFANANKK